MANKKKKKDGSGDASSEPTITQTNSAFDPNSNYGRPLADPDIGTWQEWLANEGLNPNKLKQKREQRLRERYEAAGGGADPYLTTDEGEQYATDNFDDTISYMFGMAGAQGTDFENSRFGNWLDTDYRQQLNDGYAKALIASGGNLNGADYLASAGWGATGQQSLSQPLGDTGNPYTSSSLPTKTGVQINQSMPPSWDQYKQDNGINNFGRMNNQRQKRIQNAFNATQNPAAASPAAPAAPGAPAANPNSTGGLDAARRQFLSLTPQQRGIKGATALKPGRWSIF